tara:strand:- start:471 stop:1289 length:819 start_codon:yes stop_codon:yes gene_type:complete
VDKFAYQRRCSREADISRLLAGKFCGFGHQVSDQIIANEKRPSFLVDSLRGFAPKVSGLFPSSHREELILNFVEGDLDFPTFVIELGQGRFGIPSPVYEIRQKPDHLAIADAKRNEPAQHFTVRVYTLPVEFSAVSSVGLDSHKHVSLGQLLNQFRIPLGGHPTNERGTPFFHEFPEELERSVSTIKQNEIFWAKTRGDSGCAVDFVASPTSPSTTPDSPPINVEKHDRFGTGIAGIGSSAKLFYIRGCIGKCELRSIYRPQPMPLETGRHV